MPFENELVVLELNKRDYTRLLNYIGHRGGEPFSGINITINNDGKMKGYDFDLIDQVYDLINIPMTALGGCGSLTDIEKLVERYGHIGAAAGSFFLFKGKYRAVLINYPSIIQKNAIFGKIHNVS